VAVLGLGRMGGTHVGAPKASPVLCEKLLHYIDLPHWIMCDEVEDVFSIHSSNVVDYFNHLNNHHINICVSKMELLLILTS
jgi:hypothetical protein